MKKFVITMPDEMKEALEKVSSQTQIPMSALIRQGIRTVLSDYGIEIESTVTWGGPRKEDDKS